MSQINLLRPATEADFPAIRLLIYRVGINPMGLAWQRFWVVVDIEGRLIGCGQVKPHKDGARELASIAVVPEWRGNGIASTIIQKLIAEHPVRLYLTCRERLGSFYAKFGFREAREEELTPYFRSILKIVGLVQRLRFTRDRLLVMVRG